MDKKINALAFGYASAIVSAIIMLILGILGNFGVYDRAAMAMMEYHYFFSLSPLGIISGIIEAAIIGFIFGYLFAWFYNKLAK